MLVTAWGATALRHAMEAMRRADLSEEALRVRVAMDRGVQTIWSPPNLAWLCIASPLVPERQVDVSIAGVSVEVRWRHTGLGVILAEVDATGPKGGRSRSIFWLRADSVDAEQGSGRCGGRGLRALDSSPLWSRPGE